MSQPIETTAAPVLRQSVKFGERYVSSALNRKTAGILLPGVYHGYKVKPGGPGRVLIDHDSDYPFSVAVIERNGYSLTVTMDDPGYVEIPAPGTWYIVIEALYIETQPGYERIVARETLQDHHICLAKVTVDSMDSDIEAGKIDDGSRGEVGSLVSHTSFVQLRNELNTSIKAVTTIQRQSWIVETPTAENESIDLPEGMTYLPGKNAVCLSYEGVVCYLGDNFLEMPADDDGYSRKLKLLFPTTVGDHVEVVILGHGDATLPGAQIIAGDGIVWPAVVLEKTEKAHSEICNVIESAGLEVNPNKTTQLAEAMSLLDKTFDPAEDNPEHIPGMIQDPVQTFENVLAAEK